MTFPFSRDTADDDIAPPDGERRRRVGFFVELVQVLLVSALIVIPLRYYLVQPFYVKGASMEPNFYDHEYLFIDKLSYRTHDPIRGDIVVFHYPRDESQYFIKRVIGLPGETVEIADGKIKIYNTDHENGVVLDEHAYLAEEYTGSTRTITLKQNEYFVLGDNRPSSLDSRIFGAVNRDHIVGRVWVRAYPFDRWRTFPVPSYPQL